MKNFIIIDVTGIVTFIAAVNAQQAVRLANERGYKPFTVREAQSSLSQYTLYTAMYIGYFSPVNQQTVLGQIYTRNTLYDTKHI